MSAPTCSGVIRLPTCVGRRRPTTSVPSTRRTTRTRSSPPPEGSSMGTAWAHLSHPAASQRRTRLATPRRSPLERLADSHLRVEHGDQSLRLWELEPVDRCHGHCSAEAAGPERCRRPSKGFGGEELDRKRNSGPKEKIEHLPPRHAGQQAVVQRRGQPDPVGTLAEEVTP